MTLQPVEPPAKVDAEGAMEEERDVASTAGDRTPIYNDYVEVHAPQDGLN